MKKFDIWAEGYSCTGNSQTATFFGSAYGMDFSDACRNFAKENNSFGLYLSFNRNEEPQYWGCRLFDNHQDAMESFG